jgi:hypothetical protein
MLTCNQCKREIPLVPPSRSCSLHYSLECLVGVPAEATWPLIFVLQSVRQAPDKSLKHENHASLGWKLMILNYCGHRNWLSYEQFSAFLANIKEPMGTDRPMRQDSVIWPNLKCWIQLCSFMEQSVREVQRKRWVVWLSLWSVQIQPRHALYLKRCIVFVANSQYSLTIKRPQVDG